MSVILILSDLVTSDQRGQIIRVIQQYGEWVTLSESSYAIHTEVPPDYLLRKLKEHSGVEDGLQILRVSKSYRGRAPMQVQKWLSSETARSNESVEKRSDRRFGAS